MCWSILKKGDRVKISSRGFSEKFENGLERWCNPIYANCTTHTGHKLQMSLWTLLGKEPKITLLSIRNQPREATLSCTLKFLHNCSMNGGKSISTQLAFSSQKLHILHMSGVFWQKGNAHVLSKLHREYLQSPFDLLHRLINIKFSFLHCICLVFGLIRSCRIQTTKEVISPSHWKIKICAFIFNRFWVFHLFPCRYGNLPFSVPPPETVTNPSWWLCCFLKLVKTLKVFTCN